MLMHHADAGGDGSFGFSGRQRLAESFDRSLIRHIVAEENVHQRRFAGAVLAKQADDLAAAQLDIHRVIGEKRTKPFGNAAKPKNDLRLSSFGSRLSLTSALRR